AIPGSRTLSRISATRVPANAVVFVAIIGAIITLPALKGIGGIPIAFYAITSVAVIGLYLAFAIPIFLRWKLGDDFEPGSWTLGRKYKWMNLVAVAEIGIISVYFILPFVPQGWPGSKDFTWSSVNYAPILTIGTLIVITIWWLVSARHWFTGPQHTIDEVVVEAFDD
ncbi:MAG: amino acid permease, partial [Nocardioidaceae bacterium]